MSTKYKVEFKNNAGDWECRENTEFDLDLAEREKINSELEFPDREWRIRRVRVTTLPARTKH